MAQPFFHEHTHQSILRLAQSSTHAIGLQGASGAGKMTAAAYLAAQAGAEVQYIYPEKKDVVDRENGVISIAIIRRLYTLTQGRSARRRVLVIVGAGTMSHSAQNAFLKLLEEPTANTTFILLIENPENLLPTVRSRLQIITIQNITKEQSLSLLDQLGVKDERTREQLLFIAGGLPARLTELATDASRLDREAQLLRQARTLIQGSRYERLRVAHLVKGDRHKAQSVVRYAIDLLKHEVQRRQSADDSMLRLLAALEEALRRLYTNANPRLTLAAVALSV